MNRNEVLSKFWSLWEFYKHKKDYTWKQYNSMYGDFTNFELSVDHILNNLGQDLFSNSDLIKGEILDKAKFISAKLEVDGVKSIIKDDFKNFKALESVKDVNWFFYKGDIKLLLNEEEDFVSIVGSRKTSENWKSWIGDNLPKDKIVISGLAIGADQFGHEVAMQNKQQIVVFPGIDIYKLGHKNSSLKNDIINYVIGGNGLMLTDIFPGSKSFDKSALLRRNKWMAQMSKLTYVVYFEGISGTIGQMVESLKLKKDMYLPSSIIEANRSLFSTHKAFIGWEEFIKGLNG